MTGESSIPKPNTELYKITSPADKERISTIKNGSSFTNCKSRFTKLFNAYEKNEEATLKVTLFNLIIIDTED